MFEDLTQEEKLDLYNTAKESYYNGEESPLADFEFDELEKELGLENKSRIGSFHKKNYTIPHLFKMGSISKVNVLEEEDGTIDWSKYDNLVNRCLSKSRVYRRSDWYFTASVKLDGCSWEAVVDKNGNLISCSSRGDGEYGKSLIDWFRPEWERNYEGKFKDYFQRLLNDDAHAYMFLEYLVIRGECLVKKSTFNEKYKNLFAIPRNFVSGVLNQDWKGTPEQIGFRDDLDWVSYRYIEHYENGTNVELDYVNDLDLPGNTLTDVFDYKTVDVKSLYEKFDNIRKMYDYEMDGIVIQPGIRYRLADWSRERQEDSCAIKFLPEVVPAIVKDIEWNVSKNGEYIPTGIMEDFILGGKKCNRVSFHNYGYVEKNGLWKGAKITVKLGGDIVPQVCDIVESSGDIIMLPENSYVDDVHLMKIMSMEEKSYIRLINSVKVLKPDGIGEAVATKLFELHKYDNIVSYMIGIDELKNELDDSKSSQNIINALIERKKTLNLPDLIQSMGYENCGGVNALWLAKKWSGLNPETKGIPTSIIELSETKAFNEDVSMFVLSLDLEPMKKEKVEGKIPIIMTGSPKPAYNTKDEFLKAHPQFVETTKWGEAQILFCDDLNSTSSKMEKAKKLGIEIKIYE